MKTPLLVSQVDLLHNWARDVAYMFHGEIPYWVGSSLENRDYRDVDVRLILNDDEFDKLDARLDIPMLNCTISIWGQQATGLPIDFQIQRQTNANADYPGMRSALFARRVHGQEGEVKL